MIDYLNNLVAKNTAPPDEVGQDLDMVEYELTSDEEDAAALKVAKVRTKVKLPKAEADTRSNKRQARNKAAGSGSKDNGQQ